jgi:hypothetical protein
VFEIPDASVIVFACLSIFEKEIVPDEYPLLRGVRLQADLRRVRLKPDATYYAAVKTALTKD